MASKTPYLRPLSPEFALLGLLSQKPAHGYELHQRLDTDLRQVWHVSLSQTYNILNRLEERGYLSGTFEEQEKHPTRRRFHLTPAGQQRFDQWLHTPSRCTVRAIRVEFITRLYFAQATSLDLAIDLIDAQVVETKAGLERLKTLLDRDPTADTFNRLGWTFRVRQCASLLEWLSTAVRPSHYLDTLYTLLRIEVPTLLGQDFCSNYRLIRLHNYKTNTSTTLPGPLPIPRGIC
jgi:DNA-binding PadR family transcriptional regulator